jgi:hypothetical protein
MGSCFGVPPLPSRVFEFLRAAENLTELWPGQFTRFPGSDFGKSFGEELRVHGWRHSFLYRVVIRCVDQTMIGNSAVSA